MFVEPDDLFMHTANKLQLYAKVHATAARALTRDPTVV